MRYILLLRQKEESLALAGRLLSQGIQSCFYPLLTPHPFPISPLHNPQALIITSKNALRALGLDSPFRSLPLYSVGDQTAELARSYGYREVRSGSGTVHDLTALLQAKACPSRGILWHLSGDRIRGDPAADLRERGFQAERQIVYRIEEALSLPPCLIHDLQKEIITDVLFFSPRTAEIFMALLTQEGLTSVTRTITALCFSENVFQIVNSLTWAKLWVSPAPTLAHMIGYFDEANS